MSHMLFEEECCANAESYGERGVPGAVASGAVLIAEVTILENRAHERR